MTDRRWRPWLAWGAALLGGVGCLEVAPPQIAAPDARPTLALDARPPGGDAGLGPPMLPSRDAGPGADADVNGPDAYPPCGAGRVVDARWCLGNTILSSIGAPRSDFTLTRVGQADDFFIFGGRQSRDRLLLPTTGRFDLSDGGAGRWVPLDDAPLGVWRHAAAFVPPDPGAEGPDDTDPRPAHILIVGGDQGFGDPIESPVNAALVYDFAMGADGGWHRPDRGLDDGRALATATVGLNGNVLVFGGLDHDDDGVDAERYRALLDINGDRREWSRDSLDEHLPNVRGELYRSGHVAVPLSGHRTLIAGGHSDIGAALDTWVLIEDTDPRDDTNDDDPRVSSGPGPQVSGAAAVVLDGAVYVVGGRQGGQPTGKVWRYTDAAPEGFAQPAFEVQRPRADHVALLIGPAGSEHIILLGGTAADVIEIVDPRTGLSALVDASDLRLPMLGHRGATLTDGRAFIAGGINPDGVVVATTRVFTLHPR